MISFGEWSVARWPAEGSPKGEAKRKQTCFAGLRPPLTGHAFSVAVASHSRFYFSEYRRFKNSASEKFIASPSVSAPRHVTSVPGTHRRLTSSAVHADVSIQKAENSRRKRNRTSELQNKKQRQFSMRDAVSGNLLIPWPVLRRKGPKSPDLAKLIRFKDNKGPMTEIKVYQIKSSGNKRVKEYQ